MKFLIAMLPSKYKAMITAAEQIFTNIDTEEERREIIKHIDDMFNEQGSGGTRVTVGEWAKLGSKLGILKSK